MRNRIRKPSWASIDPVLRMALREDIGRGDITTKAVLARDIMASGQVIARETMVVAGLEVARRIFQILDKKVSFDMLCREGERVRKGKILAAARGRISTLLKGERVMLNFLQRLCGIATLTEEFSRKMAGTSCRILDTRKTTPGLRALEKYAVRIGGGANHRFGLYDRVLIKNNHVDAVGGIAKALQAAYRSGYGTDDIEIEVRDLTELREALREGAGNILLDNMNVKTLHRAVQVTAGRARLEASGKVRPDNVRRIAETGVDFISIGLLTHSARSMDISFKIEPAPCFKK